MNSLTRWDPMEEMNEVQNRLFSLLGRTPWRRHDGRQETMTTAEWSPLVDISEDKDEYLIKSELPEIKKEDVNVSVENNVLTISGQRTFEQENNDESKKYHRVERSYGRFVRTFTLPDDADAEKVHADFKEGILRVHLPKSEKAKPKQINVELQ